MSTKTLITGGSRGIGAGIAEYFASQGHDVVITYRSSAAKAENLAADLSSRFGIRALALSCDVSDFQSSKDCVEKAREFLGGLDVLVNNAGITKDTNLMTMSEDQWNDVIDTNLSGTFNICRAAIVGFLRQRSGRLINISSVAGLVGIPGQCNYAASKAGIMGFSRALANGCGARGVPVNVVAPGFIDTDMTDALSEKYRDGMTKKIPLRRFGQVEEVASMVHYLTTEPASYITGQVFVIDGGLSVQGAA